MFKRCVAGATLAMSMAVLGAGAHAATVIDLVGERVQGQNVIPDFVFGTVTCADACQGLLADGTLSGTTAFADNIGNASEANEVANLNSFFDPVGTFDVSTAVKEDNGASPFTFDGAYVALKVGRMTAYIFNTAGVTQDLSYSGNQAGGLSHKTVIGALGDTPVGPPGNPPSAVPLPAGIVLLAGALGGLGWIRRKA